jgi:Fur family peroxide stress response transcriptional regulator
MIENTEKTLGKLKESGLKITPQRLAVVEILEGNTGHPSAQNIYREAKKRYPMMSFSTVYKTLKVLDEVGEIQQLSIAEDRVNFDPDTHPHHHFLCEKCGRIYDIEEDSNVRKSQIDGHTVHKTQVFYYGICSDCQKG